MKRKERCPSCGNYFTKIQNHFQQNSTCRSIIDNGGFQPPSLQPNQPLTRNASTNTATSATNRLSQSEPQSVTEIHSQHSHHSINGCHKATSVAGVKEPITGLPKLAELEQPRNQYDASTSSISQVGTLENCLDYPSH